MAKLTVNNRYATIPNHILNNPNLSLKAKGLRGYIQSKPDGREFSIERIAKQTNDGKTAIQSGLKELEDAGLLERKPCKNEKGQRDGYDYVLHEKPLTENQPTDNLLTENIVTFSNKEYSKKETVKKKQSSKKEGFEKIWSAYPHARKAKKKDTQERYDKCDYVFQVVMEEIKILKRKIATGKQDGQYMPAMERRMRDFVPTNEAVKKQFLRNTMIELQGTEQRDEFNNDRGKETLKPIWDEMKKQERQQTIKALSSN